MLGTRHVAEIDRIFHGVAGPAIFRQPGAGGFADVAQPAAVTQQGIAGQQRQAVAVAEDRQTVVINRLGGGQGFRRAEQLLDVVDPQDASALEHGVVDRILERAGPKVARLEHDHRLDPGGGAGGGDELAAVAGKLHVNQNGAGGVIAQQIVQQIAQIHVPAHPHRDDVRKPDIAAGGPIDHAAHDRRRLTQQRQSAHQRAGGIEAGVDSDRGHRVTEMVRPHDPQQIGLGGFQDLLFQGFAAIGKFAQQALLGVFRLGVAIALQGFPGEQ